MSLVVWLPLNGDSRNLGTSNISFSKTGLTEVASGKTGSCFYNAGSHTGHGLCSSSTISLGSKQSMFCWVKFESLSSSSNLGAGLVGQHRYGNNTGLGITIKYVSSTTGYLSMNTGTGTDRTYNAYCGGTLLQANTWYHVGFTYNGSIAKLYVNGQLDGTHTIGTMSVPSEYLQAFAWSFSGSSGSSFYASDYQLHGWLNDVRIYDHCLSYSEVKKISRALVAYYPLSSSSVEPTTNYSTTWSAYTNYWNIISQEPGKIVLKKNTSSSSSQVALQCSNVTSNMAVGQTWTMSCYLYKNGNPHKTTSYYVSTYDYPTVSYESREDGYFRITFTVGTVETWVLHCPLFENCVNGDIGEIRFLQFERKDHATSYIQSSRPGLLVEDNSGYNRHGTASSSTYPIVSYDSSKRLSSYKFNSYTKYITLDSSFLPSFTTGSVEWWSKVSSLGSSGVLPFTGPTTGYYLAASSSWTGSFYNGSVSASGTIKYYIDGVQDNTPNGADAEWHHYVVTGINLSSWTELYVNHYSNTSDWNSSNIQYSNIKFYNTILDAATVSELYKNYAAIYSDNTLYTSEFIESPGINMLDAINTSITRKTLSNGLSSYTQANCSVTLTDNGYRIYRAPNLTTSANGNTMWGGFVIKPYDMYNRDVLVKGHTYIIKFNVKGKSSNTAEIVWSNQIGWGGGGLSPQPSDVSYLTTPSNFNGEMECFYKWTINDDVWKTCTESYSGFVAGTSYLSYRDFKYGFGYASTGSLGTDLYITNIRMYDITEGELPVSITTSGVCQGTLIENNLNKVSFNRGNEVFASEFSEY